MRRRISTSGLVYLICQGIVPPTRLLNQAQPCPFRGQPSCPSMVRLRRSRAFDFNQDRAVRPSKYTGPQLADGKTLVHLHRATFHNLVCCSHSPTVAFPRLCNRRPYRVWLRQVLAITIHVTTVASSHQQLFIAQHMSTPTLSP